ncbi:hypothetical protein PR08_gp65 [Idiomarinaceae phage Phi1M2-2]|uniref:hypothetical protein n=1 Tax=Idiomarinaceae phage Phi1M2-2 TaxID=1527515 RepID=UPI0004F6E6D7|nr:hypothetical protein PR08_gp65 [Idiomarinaceae phage Phi1M2-2]AIM40822.1 hypothetical protein M22_065 [Idiomarinaceae phage Phi1M2-2]
MVALLISDESTRRGLKGRESINPEPFEPPVECVECQVVIGGMEQYGWVEQEPCCKTG